MALSRLAAELIEVKPLLRDVAEGVGRINSATQQVLDNTTVAPIGGVPQGPTLFGPSGAPIGGGGRLGPGSIQQFLDQLARRQSQPTVGSGGGGGGGGGSFAERPASPQEKNLMDFLREDLSYIRKLMAAASWARLPVDVVIRATKAERDALIAAFDASGGGGRAGSSSSGGVGYQMGTRVVRTDNLGNYYDSPSYNEIPIAPLTPPGQALDIIQSTYAQSQAAAKMTADGLQSLQNEPTAGDQLVADAINRSTDAINKLTSVTQLSGVQVRAAGGI